jgi:hypothetical protein
MYRELNDPNDLYKAFCVSDDVKTDMKLDANELSPDDVIQVSSSVQFFCRKCDNLLDSDYFNFLMEAEFKEEISDEKPEIYCEAAGVLEGKETTQYYVPNLSDEATKKNFKAKYKKLGFKNALTVNRKVQYSSIYCVGVLTKWEANHVTFNELQEGIKNQSLVSNDNTENKNRNNWFIICAVALFLGGLCYFFGCNASNEEILPDVDGPSNYFPSAKDLVLQVKEIGSVQSIDKETTKCYLSVEHSNTKVMVSDPTIGLGTQSSELDEQSKSEAVSSLKFTEETSIAESMQSESESILKAEEAEVEKNEEKTKAEDVKEEEEAEAEKNEEEEETKGEEAKEEEEEEEAKVEKTKEETITPDDSKN